MRCLHMHNGYFVSISSPLWGEDKGEGEKFNPRPSPLPEEEGIYERAGF